MDPELKTDLDLALDFTFEDLVAQLQTPALQPDDALRRAEAAEREAEGYKRAMAILKAQHADELAMLKRQSQGQIWAVRHRMAQLEGELLAQRALSTCLACMRRPRSMRNSECGHVALCKQCAPKVPSCPLCATKMHRPMKVLLTPHELA